MELLQILSEPVANIEWNCCKYRLGGWVMGMTVANIEWNCCKYHVKLLQILSGTVANIGWEAG